MNLFTRCLSTLLLLISWSCMQVNAQQKSGAEAEISGIRAEFKRINTLPLTKEQFNYDAAGCVDGGVVTYFFDKHQIVKITEAGSIGDGSWTREYYYQSGKFIFCYEMIIGGPAIGPETKSEYRTYVNNDQVIRYMEDKKILPAESKAKGEVVTAYKLVKAYTARDFEAVLCQ
jgi:hypothetical protein